MVVKRFDVYLIELDPAIGSEIKKLPGDNFTVALHSSVP
jgi:hypothetical protein